MNYVIFEGGYLHNALSIKTNTLCKQINSI